VILVNTGGAVTTTHGVFIYLFILRLMTLCEPGSSVGMTNYGLDGPGSNLDGDDIFRPSRPALGPTPVKWVPDLSQG